MRLQYIKNKDTFGNQQEKYKLPNKIAKTINLALKEKSKN